MKKENKIFKLCKKLQPIYRSITGIGNYKTLKILKSINKELKIISFKSGTKVFDWKVPDEWNIKDAYVIDLVSGKKIIDFKKNMLSVVGYSKPINKHVSLNTLKSKIFSLKNQRNATPYVNYFYSKNWGFSLPYNEKKKITGKKFKVKIDSYFKKGKLHIGEIFLKGKSNKEIILSSYICHPYMANNELSGPAVLIYLSNWLRKNKKRKYSYRILFSSETIGTISYISKKINTLKKNVIGGYVITCVGDQREYSYLKSKEENSLSDRVAIEVMKKTKSKLKIYNWRDRGSDERQFNAPGVNLKIGSIMRSKYDTFREYHTSEDKLYKVVTPQGLLQSYELIKKIIMNFEKKELPVSTVKCEPFLSKRNLYFKPSIKGSFKKYNRRLWDFISYCDGTLFLDEIAKKIKIPLNQAKKILNVLYKEKLIKY